MSLSAKNIASAISGLTIGSIKVKDIDEIPEQVQPRDTPILFPNPDGWLEGGNAEPADGPATFGPAANRLWIFSRTLNYVYLHAPVGSNRGLFAQIPSLSDAADAITEALLGLDISQVDVQSVRVSGFSVLTAPDGANYFGFSLALTCREKVNP